VDPISSQSVRVVSIADKGLQEFPKLLLERSYFLYFLTLMVYVLAYDPFPDNKIQELHVLFNSVLNKQDNDRHSIHPHL